MRNTRKLTAVLTLLTLIANVMIAVPAFADETEFSSLVAKLDFEQMSDEDVGELFSTGGDLSGVGTSVVADPDDESNNVMAVSWNGIGGSGYNWNQVSFTGEKIAADLANTREPYTVFDFKVRFDDEGSMANSSVALMGPQISKADEHFGGNVRRITGGATDVSTTTWSGGHVTFAEMAGEMWWDMRIAHWFSNGANYVGAYVKPSSDDEWMYSINLTRINDGEIPAPITNFALMYIFMYKGETNPKNVYFDDFTIYKASDSSQILNPNIISLDIIQSEKTTSVSGQADALIGKTEANVISRGLSTDAIMFEGTTEVDSETGEFSGEFDNLLTKNGEYVLYVSEGDTNVIVKDYTVDIFDGKPPVIKLNGPFAVDLYKGDEYIEFGAYATDNFEDGYVVTHEIDISGEIDTTVPGEQIIKYDVTDSNDNKARTVMRIINVLDSERPSETAGETSIVEAFNKEDISETKAEEIIKSLDTAGTYEKIASKQYLSETLLKSAPYDSYVSLYNACNKLIYKTLSAETELMYYLRTASESEDIKQIFESASLMEIIECELYSELANKDVVSEAVFAENFEDASAAIAFINNIVRVEYKKTAFYEDVNNATVNSIGKIIEENADVLNLDIDGDYSKINKEPIFKELCSTDFETVYEIIEVFSKIYTQQCVIYEINNGTRGEIQSIIENNSEVLGVTFDGLKSTQAYELAKLLTEDTYYDLSDFQKEFKSKKNEVLSEEKPKKSSGGGGGRSTVKLPLAEQSIAPEAPVLPEKPPIDETAMFNDVSAQHWAYDVIKYFCEKGVVSGDENRNFNPDSEVTRAEFVKMIMVALGYSEANGKCDFEDVADEHWCNRYIAEACSKGFVTGITDNTFGPDANIKRQDIAVIINRVLEYAEISGETSDAEVSDFEYIDTYASSAVTNLMAHKIVSGYPDNTFRPHLTATRAEALQLIYRLIEKM